MGVAPVAPYIEMCAALDDDAPHERQLGMRADLAILARCDEFWMVGLDRSNGMLDERDVAEQLGLPIWWFQSPDSEAAAEWLRRATV